MNWNSRYAPVGVTKLLVRPALPDLDEGESFESRDDLARSQNGQGSHAAFLCDANSLSTDEFSFAGRITILEQHGHDLLEVGSQLFLGVALAMRARKPRHIADEKTGIGVAFYNGSERVHDPIIAESPVTCLVSSCR